MPKESFLRLALSLSFVVLCVLGQESGSDSSLADQDRGSERPEVVEDLSQYYGRDLEDETQDEDSFHSEQESTNVPQFALASYLYGRNLGEYDGGTYQVHSKAQPTNQTGLTLRRRRRSQEDLDTAATGYGGHG